MKKLTRIKKISLTAAQIKTLNSVPVELVGAPPTGFVLIPEKVTYKFNYGSVAFDAGTDTLILKTDTATANHHSLANLIKVTASKYLSVTPVGGAVGVEHVKEKALLLTAGADSTVGNSTMDVYVTYSLLEE